ncbi:DNA repair protein RecN [Oryzomicrobium sp.]|uniref:DNA repair protein RecN n=1 Tax=Oryzomicrobium sp. TaxID=1911578 RepID=UPI0025F5807D|nr:DNA repair protein RecN [Oryzomicrobium sp.]MCE1244590.1 DNA repair protein RecN [Oryzomicrobium sp.]
MLQRLTIRDFVIVDRLELEFAQGFGAFTGETGAGKSILVDALAFVLGERADSGLVRAGAARAEVTAAFDVAALPGVGEWLAEQDLAAPEDGELLLRRVLEAGGRSRAYINGSPATLQQLKAVAEDLVDIHGQHAHQSLLRGDAQRALLDGQAGLRDDVRAVGEAWRAWQDARTLFDEAERNGAQLAEERERLAWEVQELESLGLAGDEWESLNLEHKRLAHAASLIDGARYSLNVLSDAEGACEGQLDGALTRLDDLSSFDPGLAAVAELLRSAQTELVEAVSELRRYADRVELDPDRLAEAERRIDAVLSCARKYRETPETLPARLESARQRLAQLGEASDLEALVARVAAAESRYRGLAQALSKKRAKAAEALGKEVSAVMQELALSGGKFQIGLVPFEDGSAHGLEQVEFRIAGLSGSAAKPLAKVASGGELSRISLAIQVVTTRQAKVPTLVFDEVDVGIGGGVAEVVGRLLHRLGQDRQVLCVTHLPQVAARADHQWQVAKSQKGGEVLSRVLSLDAPGRVEEIARMLGGVEITATTRRHAEEMLAAG